MDIYQKRIIRAEPLERYFRGEIDADMGHHAMAFSVGRTQMTECPTPSRSQLKAAAESMMVRDGLSRLTSFQVHVLRVTYTPPVSLPPGSSRYGTCGPLHARRRAEREHERKALTARRDGFKGDSQAYRHAQEAVKAWDESLLAGVRMDVMSAHVAWGKAWSATVSDWGSYRRMRASGEAQAIQGEVAKAFDGPVKASVRPAAPSERERLLSDLTDLVRAARGEEGVDAA